MKFWCVRHALVVLLERGQTCDLLSSFVFPMGDVRWLMGIVRGIRVQFIDVKFPGLVQDEQ